MARREDIDRTKGLAILLVVFGHLVARADPAGVSWYEPLRRAVYAFHMPLFLYLSGLVAVGSGMLLAPRAAWPGMARRRAMRLLVPFFGFGLLVMFGKLALCRVVFVDHPPAGWRAGLDGLLWHTANSPALSIWYLFVLFVVSVVCAFVLDGRPARLWWLLVVALAMYALVWPDDVYLPQLGRYAVFFVLGAGAALLGAQWDDFMRRRWRWLLAVFVAGLAADAMFGGGWPQELTLFCFGVLSMPAVHGLLRYSRLSSSQTLLWFGRYSFMIYLFNTMFIGVTKGMLLLVVSWNGADFLPFAVVLMAAGSLGPVALKRYGLRWVPILDRMTD